jgi:hypothetical protein
MMGPKLYVVIVNLPECEVDIFVGNEYSVHIGISFFRSVFEMHTFPTQPNVN